MRNLGLSVLSFALIHFTSCSSNYILYDVFQGEGFNLRRDVYIRIANLVRLLRRSALEYGSDISNWTLVLPPWGPLPHWMAASNRFDRRLKGESGELLRTDFIGIPWSQYFDLSSLSQVLPVLEFSDFLRSVQNTHPNTVPTVDLALHLIPDPVLGLSQKERDVKFCSSPIRDLYTTVSNLQDPPFRLFPHLSSDGGHGVLFASRYDCITGDLEAKLLAPFLGRLINDSKRNTPIRSIYLNSAESIIHGHFSEWSKEYWTVRRSMVFSLHLRQLGDDFRMRALNSSDIPDRTLPPSPVPGKTNGSHWLRPHWPLAPAIGGPYVAVHWRCGDYVSASAHPWANTPSPGLLAEQILHTMELVNSNSSIPITKVFLSTDGSEIDVIELKERIAPLQVVQFIPSAAQWEQYGPGGLAIVDQWISAHARLFIGTNPSTFTFRIAEERTIMGFPFAATFNALCVEGGARLYMQSMQLTNKRYGCEALTAWPVIFEDEFTVADPVDKLLHTEL
ncbi:Peptide-O-fucosyltransferase [Paragonimus heterotremus]|uniref:GDP-fucose protein O-fucosyltransferase 2 n=1 Tax=Paragonimus heterotremus TaxID=100268 RepID=A0A8J4SX95_9TREM|nr:Peptide-O-fucosyltransferase [Paragonimus heterotremus]